ncbi:MAG: SPFH domain-containing protein [Pseudomonadota bacterium]
MQEKPRKSSQGLLTAIVFGALLLANLATLAYAIDGDKDSLVVCCILLIPLIIFMLKGLYTVEPNQSAVLSFFGEYVGTVKDQGLRWNNPFFMKRHISLRVRNFESGKLKVNDKEGSPIEIASIVVWEVVDSAEAVFNVDHFESFVQIQSESAVRAIAGSYAYDQDDTGEEPSLRSHPQLISEHLKNQIQERVGKAGVRVVEARISHLAYSPEIAQAMLQRQQASAIIAARARIVEGAVSMVEMALSELKNKGVVDLDEERRATMVSNLLVVLCSDKATQPIVNTGTLY